MSHPPIDNYLHERPLDTEALRAEARLARAGFDVEDGGRR